MEKIYLSENKNYDLETLDLNEPHVLDSIELSRTDRNKYGLISLILSIIAIFVFFIPINNNIPLESSTREPLPL